MHAIKAPKKLIEVALPLNDINKAAAREKSIRHGHPSTLHLWWARRPLAAARAVIFAQLVNDPSWRWEMDHPGVAPPHKEKVAHAAERQRLFDLLSELVKWENTNHEGLLAQAHAEIVRSWGETCALNQDHPQAATLFDPAKLPGLHDPFAGGGAIPLEAQRLGLAAFASDLNPVAVLINKAMIEIPPKFAGQAPVHVLAAQAAARKGQVDLFEARPEEARVWRGAQGLADDVRHYGAWMRAEAEQRIGHLYPKVLITPEMAVRRDDLKGVVGQELTVIAWLWARTVKSPNPAFSHVDVPLVSSFVLFSKQGKGAWVAPVVEADGYRFEVRVGEPPEAAKAGTKLGRGANFQCVMSGAAIEPAYIYAEARAGRMSERLFAIVAEGVRGRVYLDPLVEHEALARIAQPEWKPELKMPENPRWFSPPGYGLTTYGDLFTPRQLVALTTFSDLVAEARARAQADAIEAGLSDDDVGLAEGGRGARAYGEAVGVYLAFVNSRMADRQSALCRWDPNPSGYAPKIANTFGRQALPMVWDFAEGNVFSNSSGNLTDAIGWITKVMINTTINNENGISSNVNAMDIELYMRFISTDPPYYDNIGYADLSDFFYVWLRRTLRSTFPALFATMAVPKAEELVATPYRHGSKKAAEDFFLEGMTQAMTRLAEQSHPAAPVTIYYAFKQSETKNNNDTSSTGWETFLEAVMRAGFALTGTWPMRTELGNRMISSGTNALASSIVLVCRKRALDAHTTSRRQFIRELNRALPLALDEMTSTNDNDPLRAPVAPVDLSQAIIGPGMAIFSRYAAVLEADGTPMTVKAALQLINRFLAEDDFDAETQFCLRWFEQCGWGEGVYGEADVLARAKATSVGAAVSAGVVVSGGGKVRLRPWSDYPQAPNLAEAPRLPVWGALHQMVPLFRAKGEADTGLYLGAIKNKADAIRQLAYRLYTLCERRGWAEDARVYNELVTSWSALEARAATVPDPKEQLDYLKGQ
ncbi:DUF1156 domain-containing protein [Myxococcota bacterium]|nr:DUF1156 domain-containing protein [Myxococcota bacterium]MBU1897763.1 DUF1156 domain-containing protein [Myxococcota bacterium]